MEEIASLAFAGLVLGITHAFDADHVAAVSTIVSEKKRPAESAAIGIIWGLGHTLTLLAAVIGMFAIGFKFPGQILENAEMIIGIMLLMLGVIAIKKGLREKIHAHEHKHGVAMHSHIHQHIFEKGHEHLHEKRSFFVGIIHGLAGSAAVMLVIASSASGPIDSLWYILAFGIGTTIGMAAITALMSIPISVMAKANGAGVIQTVCGMFSVTIGLFIMGQTLVPLVRLVL